MKHWMDWCLILESVITARGCCPQTWKLQVSKVRSTNRSRTKIRPLDKNKCSVKTLTWISSQEEEAAVVVKMFAVVDRSATML